MVSTQSCGPRMAARAARWVAELTHEAIASWTGAITSSIGAGPVR